MDLTQNLPIMLVALGIEWRFGYPPWVLRRIGHPVIWMGALIGWLERRLNQPSWPHPLRYVAGVCATLLVLVVVVAVALLPGAAGGFGVDGAVTEARDQAHAAAPLATLSGALVSVLLAASLLAARSLREHVLRVHQPLREGNHEGARAAVAHIVGRDVAALDEAGISRASLETLAESTCDGVVAPLCFGVAFGLPGLVLYKAINTLDSMIGHRSVRLQAFGGFAARLDDVANWLPARCTALLFLLAGLDRRGAGAAAGGEGLGKVPGRLAIVRRDGAAHRSVNAGWPEAALAAALGVRLSGPRSYGGRVTEEPWINGEAPDPDIHAVAAGLALYARVLRLLAGMMALGLLAAMMWS